MKAIVGMPGISRALDRRRDRLRVDREHQQYVDAPADQIVGIARLLGNVHVGGREDQFDLARRGCGEFVQALVGCGPGSVLHTRPGHADGNLALCAHEAGCSQCGSGSSRRRNKATAGQSCHGSLHISSIWVDESLSLIATE